MITMALATLIILPDEMLKIGLRLAGYKQRRMDRAKKETNIEHFKAQHKLSPAAVAAIWEDLKLTEVPEACVDVKDWKIKFFLIALHHLKRYPREAKFDAFLRWS
jgi:hypothetical protein